MSLGLKALVFLSLFFGILFIVVFLHCLLLKLTKISYLKGKRFSKMHVADIEFYEILKSKLGDKEAKTLVEYIEAKVEKKFEEKKDILATKEDLANIKADLMVEIEKVRTEMQNIKADIIKWMFLFWLGQLASFVAILQIFFR